MTQTLKKSIEDNRIVFTTETPLGNATITLEKKDDTLLTIKIEHALFQKLIPLSIPDTITQIEEFLKWLRTAKQH